MSPAFRIKVSSRAAAQIRKAAEWWSINRPFAPGAVRADIGEALALLANQPGIGVPVPNTKTSGVRRLLVGRIRFYIDYRVTIDTVEVLAVWHASRGTGPSL
ncbi:MAG: type II toxin-antitoxin system RelE/ParE family toxin [Gammaproteobacteria bacterium]